MTNDLEPVETTACLILIGNELLSGRTQDKNLAFIATELNEVGVRLREARVIPDVRETIVATLNECRVKHDYVFTTGGIGPTHDDITTECVAAAFGVGLYRDPVTVDLLTQRTRERGQEMNEARLRMATFPVGAELLPNSISAAPGYRLDNVFVMAGIPRVMQVMFEAARSQLRGGRKVQARSVAVDLGEGTIADCLSALQAKHPSIDIGSYPQMRPVGFRVSVVLRSTDEAMLDRVTEELIGALRAIGGDPQLEDIATAQSTAEPEG
jgi:molybdenum cofactor synthesis domain-containing protein